MVSKKMQVLNNLLVKELLVCIVDRRRTGPSVLLELRFGVCGQRKRKSQAKEVCAPITIGEEFLKQSWQPWYMVLPVFTLPCQRFPGT